MAKNPITKGHLLESMAEIELVKGIAQAEHDQVLQAAIETAKKDKAARL